METRIHLFITHLPLFGAAFGLITLLIGMRWKNSQTVKAAYVLLFITALAAVTAYITGEGAEETVEHLPGISEEAIEEHEEAGKFALIAFIPIGLIALGGLIVKNAKWHRVAPVITIVLTLFSMTVTYRVASLGGQIRHPEINGPVVTEVESATEKTPFVPGLTRDGDKKWTANSETTQAIHNMKERVDALPENADGEQIVTLKQELKYEYKELVSNCTMSGEAHEQLHHYIQPLEARISSLNETTSRQTVMELRKYLDVYADYFE